MNQIRIISDLHGNIQKHLQLIKNCEYSICIGDVGFKYQYLDKINGTKHKVFRGNHDHLGMQDYNNYLGKYGRFNLNNIDGFFISGADSIDKQYRTKNITWWEDEQLSYMELVKAYELFLTVKPDFVLTHDCPKAVSKIIGNPEILREFGHNPGTYTNSTQECLEACFSDYQPKLWIFGHYHKFSDFVLNNTRFICLPEYGYCDINDNLDMAF